MEFRGFVDQIGACKYLNLKYLNISAPLFGEAYARKIKKR